MSMGQFGSEMAGDRIDRLLEEARTVHAGSAPKASAAIRRRFSRRRRTGLPNGVLQIVGRSRRLSANGRGTQP